MAQNTQALPDPAEAYQQLFNNVHAQVFIGKLASYGIHPSTEKEAADLFDLAGQLRHVDSNEKQAENHSRFTGAVSALNSVLGASPQTVQQNYANRSQAVKQAAFELSKDPSVYNAVLSLKAAEAEILNSSN